jgi:predicted HTH domain antitoxin
MTTIRHELDSDAFTALRLSPTEFAREMRIAAAVQWYNQGLVSQEKAAKLAGLSRIEFLDDLKRREIGACQFTLEDLREEIHGK